MQRLVEFLLILWNNFRKKANQLNANNQKIAAHSYDLVQLQIWSLLPAFCNSSADVKENFKLIARTVGNLIAEKKHIRIHGMAALRKLITKNQSNFINTFIIEFQFQIIKFFFHLRKETK